MSAFVVTDKTINNFLTYLETSDGKDWINRRLSEIGHKLLGDSDLGKELFDLNCWAINARYGDNQAEEFRPLDYKYKTEPYCTRYQALSSLKCWLYQCEQGDIPDSELHKLFNNIAGNIAMDIVSDIPQYQKATWD